MPNTKTIRGFFIDPENNTAEERTIPKSLDSYYSLLRCDTIDIVSRVVGGECYDIICDDEGLLKDPHYISAVDHYGKPALVGALFVVKYDGVEDVCDLSEPDVDNLDLHLVNLIDEKGDNLFTYRALYGLC